MTMMLRFQKIILAMLPTSLVAQKIGTNFMEQHPSMSLSSCTSAGCTTETKSVVLDGNWRWVHDQGYTNCYKGSDWDKSLCPDPLTCSKNCRLDGVGLDQYANTYGIHGEDGGIRLVFVTETQYGKNFGSRVYMMDTDDSYKIFKMKNREISFSVDVSHLPCGLNGAVYFVEMEADGGRSSSNGLNEAGAKYGTGYCDAQCPHDIKFINGEANVLNWNATATPPVGNFGTCCAEMDLWEANSRAAAYTAHPCTTEGQTRCEGTQCGDKEHRYEGMCDKDGCDFNSFRMSSKGFFGRGSSFAVDTTQKFTLVTQFITDDGTDSGSLADIRRFYVQNGKVIPNSYSSFAQAPGNSITDHFCSEAKSLFQDVNDFERKGGLKVMGEALNRGMVLVFSLWDDPLANMLWLDSTYPVGSAKPGALRGPCQTTTGTPEYVRGNFPSASVQLSDVKVGTINSTFSSNGSGGSDPYGGG